MEIYNSFDTTLKKALEEIDPQWEGYNGLIIAGTHSPKDWEQQISLLESARKSGRITLGICFGYQLMAIEFARNVLGIKDATSAEFGKLGTIVVYKLSSLNVGLIKGETYWNNYAVVDDIQIRMAKELFKPNYSGVQFHPEYQSSKDKPHSILKRFLNECKLAL